MVKLIVANRSAERAHALAQRYQAKVIGLHEIPDYLPLSDMIVSSTASTLPIIGKGAIESALPKRQHRSMFLLDLAVPRDIEPEVSELDNVFLYSIDDLQQVVSDNKASRQNAAAQAELIVEQTTHEFMHWMQSLNTTPTVRDLRHHASELTAQQLAVAERRLKAGDDPQEVLQRFAHTLKQKYMHQPTEWLSQQADDEHLRLARRLFGLDTNDSD